MATFLKLLYVTRSLNLSTGRALSPPPALMLFHCRRPSQSRVRASPYRTAPAPRLGEHGGRRRFAFTFRTASPELWRSFPSVPWTALMEASQALRCTSSCLRLVVMYHSCSLMLICQFIKLSNNSIIFLPVLFDDRLIQHELHVDNRQVILVSAK